MSSNDNNDDQPKLSRRDLIAAGAAMGLTATPGFLSWGEENRVGPLDTHNVQDNGEFVEQDPSPFNLADNLDVNKRSEGIDVSVFDQWNQRDDGTLEGPAVDAGSVDTEQGPHEERYIATDDDPQAIIDDAGANSEIVFLPGSHTPPLSSTSDGQQLPISNDNVKLRFVAGATLKRPDNALASGDKGRIIRVGAGVSDTTIVGEGTIDGNKANNAVSGVEDASCVYVEEGASNIRVGDGLAIQNAVGDAVLANGTSASHITNVRVEGATIQDCEEGILWRYADDVQILNNHIENITWQDAIEPSRSDGWVVEGNTIKTVQQSAVDVYNAAIDGVISDNTIIDAAQTSEDGIAIGSDTGTGNAVTDVVVQGNVVKNAGGGGIKVRGNSDDNNHDITIANNRVVGSGAANINVAANTRRIDVEDNGVRQAQNDGIIVGASQDTDLVGNTCVNNNQSNTSNNSGIRINNGTGVRVKDNACYDTQSTVTQDVGINIQTAPTNVTVSNNDAYRNKTKGILVQATEVEVKGNTAYNNDQGGGGNDGIRITGDVDHAVVQSNTSYDDQGTATQRYGISLASVTNSLVEHNVTYGNGTGGIVDNSATSTTVEENHAL